MKLDSQVIKRYLDGLGSEEDKKKLRDWFNSLEAETELRNESHRYWDELPLDIDTQEYDESSILGEVYRTIKREEAAKKTSPSTPVRVLRFLTKIAAVLFVPLLVLYLTGDNKSLRSSALTYTEIYSPLGSRTIFYLPDGSKGWLNGGSYLKFPEQFQGKTRDVSLRGEAFFDIETNPKKPFVVSGDGLDIVAKGTSFNVRAWKDDTVTKVVLVEGKLEVFHHVNGNHALVASLRPGQLLHYEGKSHGNYIQNVDVDKHIAWTEGKLIFREDPFGNVVEELNRWYNVHIVIKDEILETYNYVATFQDETLDEILKLLKISAPIDYKNIPRKQAEDGTFEKRTIELYYMP